MRNCIARVVLPEPGTPSTRYSRCGVNPPFITSSSPSTPVDANMRAGLSVTVEAVDMIRPPCCKGLPSGLIGITRGTGPGAGPEVNGRKIRGMVHDVSLLLQFSVSREFALIGGLQRGL